MIVKCQKNDEQIVESYIGKEYYKCLYLYMNLQRYGIGSQAIDVYMDKRENEIKAVYLFYFSCVHVYSKDNDFSVLELKELIKDHPTKMIYCEKNTAEYIGDDYSSSERPFTITYGWVAEITNVDTKKALLAGKHVLCESPIALKEADCEELYSIAEEHGLVLMDAIKTAYSTAYERLVLLAKSGKIGKVVSVDAVCTSLRDGISIAGTDLTQKWNSMCGWAPAALLPVFQILGTGYRKKVITTKFLDEAANMDAFTKIDFTYDDAVASIKVAKAAKSEGELIVTGTKGYIYVPAPWWKTDYFEVRYEHAEDNQRFFYQLDGEGIRYEIVAFAKSIEVKKPMNYVEKAVSKSIAKIIESFNDRADMIVI